MVLQETQDQAVMGLELSISVLMKLVPMQVRPSLPEDWIHLIGPSVLGFMVPVVVPVDTVEVDLVVRQVIMDQEALALRLGRRAVLVLQHRRREDRAAHMQHVHHHQVPQQIGAARARARGGVCGCSKVCAELIRVCARRLWQRGLPRSRCAASKHAAAAGCSVV